MPLFDSTHAFKNSKSSLDVAPEIQKDIINKASDKSAILSIAPEAKMSITGNAFKIRTKRPEADIVDEGGAKPLDGFEHQIITVNPIKAALITTWSREKRLDDAEGLLADMTSELSSAIARQVDLAVIHGKSAKSGQDIPGVTALADSTNTVTLGTAKKEDGGLAQDILTGAALVDAADGDFNGLISDKSLRLQYLAARDALGRPLHAQSVDVTSPVDSILGVRNTYSRSVRGNIGANADSGIAAIGGDFANAIRIGFVDKLSIKLSDQATLTDGGQTISLWQHNLEAALVEATFSFVIFDVNKFVLYKSA